MLTKGKVFRDYKELCCFMGWEYVGGSTKKANFKILDTLCSWHKEGNKIIIDEVYQFQKDKVDGRSKNNIYIDSAESLIREKLKKSSDTTTFITVGKLGEYIGLFNKQYQNADHENLKIDFTIFNSFKMTTNAEAKRILDRCLKSMARRRLLEYTYTKIIVCKDGELRGANADEREIIQGIENKVMKELGCYNFTKIKQHNLIALFNSKVREEVNYSINDFESSFNGYEIQRTKKLVAEVERELKTKEKKIELNMLFVQKLNNAFKEKHIYSKNKQLENHEFGEAIIKYEGSTEYISTVRKLVTDLIRIECKS